MNEQVSLNLRQSKDGLILNIKIPSKTFKNLIVN